MSEHNIIAEVYDELYKAIRLVRCLKDAQLGLAQHHSEADNHFWLTEEIDDRLGKIFDTLDKETKQPDETSGSKSILRLKKAVEKIVKQRNGLFTENAKLKKQLKKLETKNRK